MKKKRIGKDGRPVGKEIEETANVTECHAPEYVYMARFMQWRACCSIYSGGIAHTSKETATKEWDEGLKTAQQDGALRKAASRSNDTWEKQLQTWQREFETRRTHKCHMIPVPKKRP